jgi:hypothetical protein
MIAIEPGVDCVSRDSFTSFMNAASPGLRVAFVRRERLNSFMIIVFPAAGDGEYFVWKVRR